MKRRKNEIMSQILSICKEGANKTRVVYRANLNFKTANSFLELLIKNDLLEVKRRRYLTYETTKKGESLLASINEVNDLLYDN